MLSLSKHAGAASPFDKLRVALLRWRRVAITRFVLSREGRLSTRASELTEKVIGATPASDDVRPSRRRTKRRG
jgi:hypothetical protein